MYTPVTARLPADVTARCCVCRMSLLTEGPQAVRCIIQWINEEWNLSLSAHLPPFRPVLCRVSHLFTVLTLSEPSRLQPAFSHPYCSQRMFVTFTTFQHSCCFTQRDSLTFRTSAGQQEHQRDSREQKRLCAEVLHSAGLSLFWEVSAHRYFTQRVYLSFDTSVPRYFTQRDYLSFLHKEQERLCA